MDSPQNSQPREPAAPAPRSLVTKLAEVMVEVGTIPKNGRNDFHKYSYATEADVLRPVQQALGRRNVAIVSSTGEPSWREVQTKNGPQPVCMLRLKFSIRDGDTGEIIEFEGLGEGADSGDKAICKAMTSAVKYALLKLFLIPTGDDPDADGREASRRPAQAAPRQGPRTEPRVEPDPDASAPLAQQLLGELEQAEKTADETRRQRAISAADKARTGNRLTAAQHRQLSARAALAKANIAKATGTAA